MAGLVVAVVTDRKCTRRWIRWFVLRPRSFFFSFFFFCVSLTTRVGYFAVNIGIRIVHVQARVILCLIGRYIVRPWMRKRDEYNYQNYENEHSDVLCVEWAKYIQKENTSRKLTDFEFTAYEAHTVTPCTMTNRRHRLVGLRVSLHFVPSGTWHTWHPPCSWFYRILYTQNNWLFKQ